MPLCSSPATRITWRRGMQLQHGGRGDGSTKLGTPLHSKRKAAFATVLVDQPTSFPRPRGLAIGIVAAARHLHRGGVTRSGLYLEYSKQKFRSPYPAPSPPSMAAEEL